METAGWSIEETKELFSRVEKYAATGSLNKAFREIAMQFNRKPNSVRNYYYSQLKAFSLLPDMANSLGIRTRDTRKQFETFSQEEVDKLVKFILTEQGKGKSVRAITTELAQGDKSLMLRYQNKYRSVIASRRGRVDRIIAELNKEGATYRHPITNIIVRNGQDTAAPEENFEESLRSISDIFDLQGFKNLVMLAVKGRRKNSEHYLMELENKTDEVERLQRANRELASMLIELKKQK